MYRISCIHNPTDGTVYCPVVVGEPSLTVAIAVPDKLGPYANTSLLSPASSVPHYVAPMKEPPLVACIYLTSHHRPSYCIPSYTIISSYINNSIQFHLTHKHAPLPRRSRPRPLHRQLPRPAPASHASGRARRRVLGGVQ